MGDIAMKKYLISVALAAFALVSCNIEQEVDTPVAPTGKSVKFSAELVQTRTVLGAKEGTSYPVLWSAGDVVSVNGVASDAIEAAYDGQARAEFSVTGVSAPYFAAIPASAVVSYDPAGSTVRVPAEQNWVSGSYDPAAFLLLGKSDDEKFAFSSAVSVFKLTPNGSVKIKSVKLLSNDPAVKMAGDFVTDYQNFTSVISAQDYVQVTASEPVDGGTPFFLVFVPADFSAAGITIVITDENGGTMIRSAKPNKAYEAGKLYSSSINYVADGSADMIISAEGITSSTAVICWNQSPEEAYTINVYSDADCATLVDSYAVDAGNSCWGGQSPRFCISGLAAGTTYYVKVEDPVKGKVSNVLSVSTDAFEIVQVSSTDAAVGDVLLAEDFSELRWDCDMIGVGAGWFPNSEAQAASFITLGIGSFQATATSNEKQISAQSGPVAASRLAHWAQGANPHMYVHPGYIKLVGQNKVTHIVTPALTSIPDGQLATLDVEVTASAYYSESSGSYATTKAVVAVQTDDLNELVDETKTNTLDLSSNIQSITLDEASAWKTYKVTLTGVSKGNRIAFGADKSVSGNDARMNISDIKITVKELVEPGKTLAASLKEVSSSTAAFSWTHPGADAAFDVSKPYTAAIYSNAACTNLVVSHDFEAEASCWGSKTPCFSFGGLASGTTYYFRVTDTDKNIVSDVVEVTTLDFTPVDASAVTNAKVGDVILAEDFSEIGWGPDEFAGAAGFIPSPKNLVAPSGVNPAGAYTVFDNTSNRIFGTNVDLGDSRLSHGWGFLGNSSTFLRNAYLRVGGSGGRTHMVTPVLSGIPDGMVATLEVTVTATKYDSPIQIAVFAEKDLELNTTDDTGSAKYKQYTGASLSNGVAFDIETVKEWDTKTVTITNVESDCHLLIGSLEDNVDASGTKKNRFYLSDVKVIVKALDEPGKTLSASLKEVSSSTAVFTWTHDGADAALDVSKPYKASLYSNSACTNLVVSHTFDADASYWSGKKPCFSFGGLAPSTTYWLVVEDTENGAKSSPVSATTEDFTPVDATTVRNAGIGDVILAEDFSEIGWGPDEFAVAAGFEPSPKNLVIPSGADPSGYIIPYNSTGNRIFGAGVDLGDSRLSRGWGFFGNSAAYLRNAYLRVATTTGRTHIVTPKLYGIPTDKLATLEVTITATKHESNENDVAVFVEEGLIMNTETTTTSSDFRKYTGASLSDGVAFGITKVKTWETKTVTVSNVGYGSQLVIGSLENVDGNNRFSITDVTVKITELVNDPVKKISDNTTFKEFVNAVAAGNKTLNAKVTESFDVSAVTTSSFKSIDGYEGTLNGNGYTISGLTKPLFNDLKGTVTDLTLNSTVNITADQVDMGILANVVSGTVTGCKSQGSLTFNVASGVTKEHRIGGLIGSVAESGAVVSDCINEASVTNLTSNNTDDGELIIGGVVGSFWGTEFHISGCKNKGDITSTSHWGKTPALGGIIGQGGNGTDGTSDFSIASCSNSGAISCSGSTDNSIQVGGIAGYVRFATMTSLSNSGSISNSGTAAANVCIGGILGYVDKSCDMTETKATNSGDVTNYGSGKLVSIGGVLGRNSSGYLNAKGSSSNYLSNSGTISDQSTVSGADLSVGGIVGYTTTGIKLQYARNTGAINILNGTRDADVEIGGIAGFLDNTALNVNNCRNYGDVTVSATITKDLYAGGIVGLFSYSSTGDKYNLVFEATVDTHLATVTGENCTAGLFGAHSQNKDNTAKGTCLVNGLKFKGTVYGNKTKTGLIMCSRNAESTLTFKGSCKIAPGSVRHDDSHNDTVNSSSDLTMDVLVGYLGSPSEVSGVDVEDY